MPPLARFVRACERLVATPGREALTVTFAFAVAAVLGTYPLSREIGRALPSDLGDPLLNTWILAWDADRLRHGLQGLWDAPFFHPYENALAYSEHLLGIALFTAPVQWLTGNPLVAYNAAFIGSSVLAGTGMYLLAGSLTGDRWAATAAGASFAFLPYRAEQVAHLQVLMYGWMPIALGSRRASLRSIKNFDPGHSGDLSHFRLLFWFLTQMYARFSPRQVGPRSRKTLRMCSCSVRSSALVCRSVDGRLRGPRSWWGACSAAA